MFFKNKLINLLTLLLLSAAFCLCGCSSKSSGSLSGSNSTNMNASTNTASDKADISNTNSGTPALKNDGSNANAQPTEPITQVDRKIIRTASLQLETLNFDKTTDTFLDKVTQFNGYVEKSNISGLRSNTKANMQYRNAHIVVRIPKQNFDQFISMVGSLGNLINKSINGEDITSKYFDTEAHLKALTIQENRLLEILKKTEDIKSIIELEKQLTDVRYQIETLTGNLKKYDNMIDYSTITIDINEVEDLKAINTLPTSFLDKIRDSFMDSVKILIALFKWIVIFISIIIPFLIFIIPILILILYFRRKAIKNRASIESKSNFSDTYRATNDTVDDKDLDNKN